MRLAYQSCRRCPRLSLKCGRTRPFSSPGGLAERFNAADLKSASPQGLGGSNPSPSATCSPAMSHRVFFSALSLYESAPLVPSGPVSSCGVSIRYVGRNGGRKVSRKVNRLSAKGVEKIALPGYFCDGGGLYLQVSAGLTKSWIFRFSQDGRAREMGLGSYRDVTLAEARLKAEEARKKLANGVDP